MPVTINGSGPVTGVTAITGAGLDLITTQTFSAATSVSVNGCFSATYDNYRLVLNITGASASAGLFMRMRASSADNTTSNYHSQLVYGSSASAAAVKNTSQTTWNVAELNSANTYQGATAEFLGPQKTQVTTVVWTGSQLQSTDYVTSVGGFFFGLTTQFDGFTIYPASGTITGTLRVYGYRNS